MAGETILVVDDRDDSLQFLTEYILQPNGYKFVTAKDGAKGLEIALSQTPDMIIMDLKMPKMTGLEVLAALRERSVDIPVILMTFHGSEETAVQAFRLGARADILSDRFIGEVDEVRVYDRALTTTQLGQITAVEEPPPPDYTIDLVGGYTFNRGEELSDRTGGDQSDLSNAGGVSIVGGVAEFDGAATSYLTASEAGSELRPTGAGFTLWARVRLAGGVIRSSKLPLIVAEVYCQSRFGSPLSESRKRLLIGKPSFV